MPGTAEKPTPVRRFARADLPENEYRRLKRCADRYRLSVAAYIRLAMMERIEADESR